jgi:ribosomal protein S18 acetylase RimI-like enzyme
VIHYRTFRNTDPPALAEVWNESLRGRGAVPLGNPSLLEHLVFAKLYFDPAGLILAREQETLVGFAHAGFGTDATESTLSRTDGVTCVVAVRPRHRRRGIGSELLRRCEDYLRQRGARTLHAGPMFPVNPFYQGLYGGSASCGWLETDPAAAPFLARHGYSVCRTAHVLHRRLDGPLNLADGRFPGLRRRFELKVAPAKGVSSWWHACQFGALDLSEFRLEEKSTGAVAARALVWEMEGFSRAWGETSVGLLHVEVVPELRRQGVARFLFAQTFRYLQDQFFTLIETQAPQEDQAMLNLCAGTGFAPADTGHLYRRTETA